MERVTLVTSGQANGREMGGGDGPTAGPRSSVPSSGVTITVTGSLDDVPRPSGDGLVVVTAAQMAAAADEVRSRRVHVPPGLANAEPAIVMRVARRAAEARAAADQARARLESLGPPPPMIDRVAERAVLDADAWADHAREERREAARPCLRLLLIGNGIGLALVIARLITRAAEPVFPLAGIIPLGSLAFAGLGLVRASRRTRAASAALAAALAEAGVRSIGGLTARRKKLDAWSRHSDAAVAAEHAAARAHERWVALAGADVPPHAAETFLAAADALQVAERELQTARDAHAEATVMAGHEGAITPPPPAITPPPPPPPPPPLPAAACEPLMPDSGIDGSQRPEVDLRLRVMATLERALALNSKAPPPTDP